MSRKAARGNTCVGRCHVMFEVFSPVVVQAFMEHSYVDVRLRVPQYRSSCPSEVLAPFPHQLLHDEPTHAFRTYTIDPSQRNASQDVCPPTHTHTPLTPPKQTFRVYTVSASQRNVARDTCPLPTPFTSPMRTFRVHTISASQRINVARDTCPIPSIDSTHTDIPCLYD